MALIRGDILTALLPKKHGGPHPVLLIRSDVFSGHPSLTVLAITSDLRDWPIFRIDVSPSVANGLRKPSQVMIDRVHTILRSQIGGKIGHLDRATMTEVNRALAIFLGITG